MEFLHAHDCIHRDIKPDNFMVRFDKKIHLIDFGLAQYFRDPITHIHIPQTSGNDLVGTIWYTSINSHMGIQLSRRDDLESLAYTLMYLVRGNLPWQGISIFRSRRRAVLRRKQEIRKYLSDTIPSGLTTFLDYVQSLSFQECPDYLHLHDLVQKLPIWALR